MAQIIHQTLEQAKESEAKDHEAKYTFKLRSIVDKLDGTGNVKGQEKRLYRSIPVEGIPYARLEAKDGRPLTDQESEDERTREVKFRKQVAKGEDPREKDEHEIKLDEDLVSRYGFHLDGVEEINGRPAYILSFKPKTDDLPVRRRIDHVLNRVEGTVWVDVKVYAISRIEFELTQKVRLGWGIMASISAVKGMLQQAQVDEGIWFPEQLDFYFKGRMLFHSEHFRERLWWSEFETPSRQQMGLQTVRTEP